MEPESYQQSMTSGVLCISLPHFSQVMGHLVDVGAVQFEVVRHVVAQFFQFLARADDVRVAALAHPHGQRRAPVALAGEAPSR